MTCAHCCKPLPEPSRRDRVYCSKNCGALASYYRRKAGAPPPRRWHHPALDTPHSTLRAAVDRAVELAEANGWSPATLRCALDGLTALLDTRLTGEKVLTSQIRALRPLRAAPGCVAQVLADLGLLHDDTQPPHRAWIERCAVALPAGFAPDVRAWLLVLAEGNARSAPRSRSTLHVYFSTIRPLLEHWAGHRDHLREITTRDVAEVLQPLSGWKRRNAIAALRSLFRFAKKNGRIFTNPAARLRSEEIASHVLPLTAAEIVAIEQAVTTPAQQLVVALTAVHAARPAAIRALTLDDLDLPNRRITLAGHRQRLSDLAHQTLRARLAERHARWPHTPNRHVLITRATTLNKEAVSDMYLKANFVRRGIDLERIRADRVLHEALKFGADPLHLSLVFNLSHTTASRYTAIAQQILEPDR